MTPGPPLSTSTFRAPILMVKTRSPFSTTLASLDPLPRLDRRAPLRRALGAGPSRLPDRLQPRHPADPLRELLRVPWPGPEGQEGRPEARPQGGRLPGQVGLLRDRRRRPGVERVARTDRHGRPRRGDASPQVGQDVEQGPGRPGPQLDRAGGPLGWALGLHPPEACRPPRGQGRDVAPQPDRPVRAGPDREGGAHPLARGGQGRPSSVA